MATAATTVPERRRNLGLVLCQIAVPALAIPSALGVNKFFSVADGTPEQWTAQGALAMVGFELSNVGLSILDIRRPDLHATVRQVRFWSVTAAITMNVIAHYATAAKGAAGFALIPFLLSLVASVPLALLYVKLAALLHAISEGAHAEADDRARLEAELATAREELTSRARDLARASAELVQARVASAAELAHAQAQAREHAQGLAAELAHAQATLTAEREQVARSIAQAREGEAHIREELAALRETSAAEVREARAVAARAEREVQRLAREAQALREELAARDDRSREALMREAQALQAERGWGPREIGRHLGWPESTIRGWLPAAQTASAAD